MLLTTCQNILEQTRDFNKINNFNTVTDWYTVYGRRLCQCHPKRFEGAKIPRGVDKSQTVKRRTVATTGAADSENGLLH